MKKLILLLFFLVIVISVGIFSYFNAKLTTNSYDQLTKTPESPKVTPSPTPLPVDNTKPYKSETRHVSKPVTSLEDANKFIIDPTVFPEAKNSYLHAFSAVYTLQYKIWFYSYTQIYNPHKNKDQKETRYYTSLKDVTIKNDQTYLENTYGKINEEIPQSYVNRYYESRFPHLTDFNISSSIIDTARQKLAERGIIPGQVMRINSQKCQKCDQNQIVMETDIIFVLPGEENKDEVRVKRVRFHNNDFQDVIDLTVPRGTIFPRTQ